MRQINFGDINRILLKSINLYDNEGESRKSWEFVKSNLVIELNKDSRNIILNQLYGVLSYRNHKFIDRIFERYISERQYCSDSKTEISRFNLLEIWYKLAERFLVFKDSIYINMSKFEEWKKYFHALDEDLFVLNYLIRYKFLENEPKIEYISNYISTMKTFISPYEPLVKKKLEKGIAIQHVHLTGSYPAPYYWVAIMNNRLDDENILYFNNFDQDIRYKSNEQQNSLPKLIKVAKMVRVTLFEYIKDSLENSFNPSESVKNITKIQYDEIQEIINNNDMKIEENKLYNLNEKIKKYKYDLIDYASKIDKRAISDNNITSKSLYGERLLMFYVLHYINKEECDNKDASDEGIISKLFWLYIQVKNLFLCKIQQQEGISGFDYFEYTLNTITWKENGVEINRFCDEIGEYLQESKSVIKQEFMIAPQKSEEKYNEIIRIISNIKRKMNENLSLELKAKYNEVKVGVIIHFIKNEGDYLNARLNREGNSYKIYHYSKRDENISNYRVLLEYKRLKNRSEKDYNIPIVAIDTANRELYCPPEVFGEVYKKIFDNNFKIEKEYQIRGKTFHVGEDFVSLSTGLRRIYETIFFLNIEAGDRLGHCIALGSDVGLWTHNNPTVEINLIDLLDDFVFEWYLITKNSSCDDYTRVNVLERRIAKYSNDIFGVSIKPEVLVAAWLKRGQVTSRDKKYEDEETIPSWIKVQGEIMSRESSKSGTHNVVPNLEVLEILADKHNIEYDKSKLELPVNEAERILQEYLYDKHTINKFLKIENIETLEEIDSLKKIQLMLINLIKDKGITIESNPTSNWLIGGFERTSDIPAVQWIFNDYDLPFTINIDDPAVFGNSIENEYFLVYSNLIKGTEVFEAFSRTKALEKIDKLRINSIDSSFL